eukprot:NODE_1030_length_1924_cov_0.393757.p1 type:complete len:206 gc:universal NODE_1030_length_1924_cov_0.393757:424-1041(+)
MKVLNRGSAQSKEYYCVPYKCSNLKKAKHYLILNVNFQQQVSEVGGWKKINELKISIASIYDSKKDKTLVFSESELPKLFELMYKRLTVGFGIKRLDLIVLAASGLDLNQCKFFDMMVNLEAQIWGPLLSLKSVIEGTLQSSMEFASVDLWKENDIKKLKELSIKNVNLVHELFKSGQSHGFITVKTEDVPCQIPVQWQSLTLTQ